MSEVVKSSEEWAENYRFAQKSKRLKKQRKRIFNSIKEYEDSEPEQPAPDESEEKDGTT